MKRTEWFNRKFPVIEDNGLLPAIIERLNGTAARVQEITSTLDPMLITLKPGGKWSIKEETGHLADMEPLWLGRLDDFANAVPELRIADLTNRATTEANHNATNLQLLVQRLRMQRQQFVNRLLNLDEEQLTHRALHPRLKTPMRVIDLAYFVAEHDDHHLANIRGIMDRY